jgi:ribosomal protein L20
MPKPFPKTETEIVMSVDRDAGVLDLRIFATQHKRAEVVGTATLRMADVSEVVRLCEHEILEPKPFAQHARKSRRLRARKLWIHCL